MVDIDEILSGLSAKTKSRVMAASESHLEIQPTPSIGLNLGLGGGIGYGRQTLVWGAKSAAKSSLVLQMIAEAQKDNKICAYVDVEGTFEKNWAERLGVDNGSLILGDPKTTEDMAGLVCDMMRSGVEVIAVDSISVLLGSAFFDKNDELKDLGDTKQIGNDARDMANALRMMNYANEKTALILVSQVRNQIHSYGASGRPTGGKAVEYFSSTSIKLTSTIREADQHTVTQGKLKVPVGRPVNWLVEYNKISSPGATGSFDFYYKGDRVGIDRVGEVVDYAEQYGVIQKGGAWYTVEGQRLQGRAAVVNLLREEPDIYEKVADQLNEQIKI